MELWTGVFSWWICHWPDLKSAGLFRRNLFLNSLKTSTSNPNPNSINSGVLTSLLLPHFSSSLTDSLPSLNVLCNSKTDARFMQDAPKVVWGIPYFSVASFFPSLKHNFIAYRSSKVSDFIFEIHQLWQSDFISVYSNCCCNCSFEPEIIKIGQSFHKMYSNNIRNVQESTTILNAYTKKSGNLLYAPRILNWTVWIKLFWHVYLYLTELVEIELFICIKKEFNIHNLQRLSSHKTKQSQFFSSHKLHLLCYCVWPIFALI